MSSMDLKHVEKTYKDNVKKLFGEYLKAVLTTGTVDEDLANRVSDGLIGYSSDLEDYVVVTLGGDPDAIKTWLIEALNDIKLGEMLIEYIKGEMES